MSGSATLERRAKVHVQKLSAPHSAFVKRVLPFVTVVAASAWSYQSSRDKPNALEMTLLVGIVGLIILWVVLRRGFWRMADTVEDHGDRLVITRWRTRAEIPLENVRELRRRPGLNGSYVTIRLTAPCALGSEITFLAPGRRTLREIEEKLDDLSRRIASRR
jgi:hypothetical protein